jgi:hypothetical protein
MSTEGKITLSALLVLAIWFFVGLPLIYLPSDRFGELPAKAPILTSLAASCTALIALLALLIARGQLVTNRENQRETTAKTTFREFLKLCVEYPDFAYGRIPTADDRTKYEWFVAQFLWAAEEILEYAPSAWEANLRLHVSYHSGFLQYDGQFRVEDFPTYTPKLQSFVHETIANLDRQQPQA